MLQKKLALQMEINRSLEDALYKVLNTTRLDIAKEHAAEALGEELEEFLNKDLDAMDLNFTDDAFDGEIDFAIVEQGE